MVTRDRLRSSGVPEAIADRVTAPTFDTTLPAIRAAHTAAQTTTALIVYSGGTSTGKTCAAAYTTALMSKPGREVTVLWPAEPASPGAYPTGSAWYVDRTVEVGALAELRGRWLDASACGEHLFDEVWWTRSRTAAVLVIDDLGLEGEGRVRDRMIGLVVERENHGRPTIITTNLGPEPFKRTYWTGAGERLATRLQRGMWVNVVARPRAAGDGEGEP
jgi:hypothetical protein